MKKILGFILFSTISASAFANSMGKITYQVACSNCHAPNLAKSIGAPAAFDQKAWAIRFKKAEIEVRNNPERYKTSIDYLLDSVLTGKNLMHHGGLCHESNIPVKYCSNEAFIQAIHYMSAK